MSKESTLSFKELKIELRDIVKLSKDNLDFKSWATELKLWIKIQGITDQLSNRLLIICNHGKWF